jgi:hypothetical protein
VRVRFATNDPTPWPPELPAGENPPPGGIIDYYLPNDASGEVRLEILDGSGRTVRSYSSTDPVLRPNPAIDSAAYNQLCQRTPTGPHCNLPLYWPAPPMVLSTQRGMHRFSWDLRYNPIREDTLAPSDEDAEGAVPHRTYPSVNAPWAPPGSYTVRLTVNGQRYTQPLTLRLDPRVRTPAPALQQLATVTRDLYDRALATHAAYVEARALAGNVSDPAMRSQLDSLAPAPVRAGGRRGGFARRGGGNVPQTLNGASDALIAAAMAMQSADVAPTASQLAAAARARSEANAVMTRWTTIRSRAKR